MVLTGCVVGPDYHPTSVPAPAAWTDRPVSTTTPSDLASWWRQFHDPILDRLIGQAASANTDVAQNIAKLRQARASLVQEKAGLYPTLDSSASGTRARQSLADIGGAGTITSNTYKASFDTSFELDIFGGQRRSIESADASREAAAEDLNDTVRTVLGDVARYYVEARGYQARIAVAKDTLALRTDTLHLTRAKAQGGTGTGLDAVQAQAEMESAAATIPPLEYSFRESVNRLAVLTGMPPQVMLDLLRAPKPIPRLAGTIEPDPPVAALARRPDIRAAERRVASATADIGVAQADRFPAISLAGSLGLNSSRIRSFANASSNVWSLGPTVNLPIFDAGKRAAKVDEKIADRDEKIAVWQAAVRNALEETENALIALDREQAHNIALRRTVDAYAEALKVSEVQYQAGLDTFLNVLDAGRSLANQRDDLAASDVQLAVDAIALYKALGGGWQDAGRLVEP
ncbi:MAG: efflux transporter outer membrane subunit [Telmatospirillum sp.]|nr:efflux transporter outer membrane subunit [Telmatospirillum sp.]